MNILMRFFCWLGRYSIRQIRAIGRLALFSFHVFRNIPGALSRFYLIAQQTHFIGNYSLSIISVSGLFVGFVLGLQGYYVLVRYGSDQALGVMVALSLMRELGPVVAALLFAGRAGTSLTAEIGLMRSGEQLAAMEMMGVDPIRRIVVPRFLGTVISMPLLAIIFSAVGIIGAWIVGVGLIVNGRLVTGKSGAAGEVHFPIRLDKKRRCGAAFVF